MNAPNNVSLDQALENLTKGNEQDASAVDKLVAIRRLELEAEERRAERAERAARADQERQGKSELWKTLAVIGGPIIAALMNKPAIDPALIAIIGGRNNGDELKNFMEISRQQSQMQLETTISSLTKIMEVKDAMNERIVEKAIEAAENGDNDQGIMGVLMQVAKIAGPILQQQPTAQAPAAALPAPQVTDSKPAPAQQQQPRASAPSPAFVALDTMRRIHSGTMTDKQVRIAKASLTVVIINDDKLVEALLSDDENAVISYCTPILMGNKELAAWIQLPAVGDKKAPAEWLVDFVKDEIIPRIDYEVNGPEPEELNEANTNKA